MFGDNLKKLRQARKITQSQLAEDLGLSVFTIAKYETYRRRPDYETLIRIADYFNVSLDYLLGRNGFNK